MSSLEYKQHPYWVKKMSVSFKFSPLNKSFLSFSVISEIWCVITKNNLCVLCQPNDSLPLWRYQTFWLIIKWIYKLGCFVFLFHVSFLLPMKNKTKHKVLSLKHCNYRLQRSSRLDKNRFHFSENTYQILVLQLILSWHQLWDLVRQ